MSSPRPTASSRACRSVAGPWRQPAPRSLPASAPRPVDRWGQLRRAPTTRPSAAAFGRRRVSAVAHGEPVAGPGAGPDAGPGVRASAVPKILLALGATCLLAAGAVFLAVTWSTLGVGGRTAVLVGFTLAMAALTAWSARRGFRGAVEALGLVSIGLLLLDLLGAERAGWLGSPSEPAFATGVGLLLAVVGVVSSWASRRTPAGPFSGAEAVATVAALVAVVASQGLDVRDPVLPAALVLLLLGGVTVLALALGVTSAASWLAAVTSLGWLVLLVTAAGEAAQDGELTLASMWAEGGAVGLVVTAALAALVAVPPAVPQRLRATAASATSVALTAVVVLPALDNGVLSVTVVAAGVTLLTAAALDGLARTAPAWTAATVGLLALGTVTLAVHSAGWTVRGLEAYALTAARGWSGTPGGAVEEVPPFTGLAQPWLLPLTVATLALVAIAARARRRPRHRGRALPRAAERHRPLGGPPTCPALLASSRRRDRRRSHRGVGPRRRPGTPGPGLERAARPARGSRRAGHADLAPDPAPAPLTDGAVRRPARRVRAAGRGPPLVLVRRGPHRGRPAGHPARRRGGPPPLHERAGRRRVRRVRRGRAGRSGVDPGRDAGAAGAGDGVDRHRPRRAGGRAGPGERAPPPRRSAAARGRAGLRRLGRPAAAARRRCGAPHRRPGPRST